MSTTGIGVVFNIDGFGSGLYGDKAWGCGWVPYLMERIDRRTKGLASVQVRTSPIYFHAELEEEYVLPTALNFVGDDRFIYASDYPHESHEAAIEALDQFLAREDVTVASKNKILCDNIKTLYGF